jgi:CxxC-x17-CxxC domain-containing protein
MDSYKKGRKPTRFGGDRERSNDRGGDRGGFRGNSRGGSSFGGGFSSDRRSSGGRPSFGNDRNSRPRQPLEFHHAVCSKCHNSCEVPFKPFEGKEVFCNNCFSKDGQSPSKSFGRNDAPRQAVQETNPLVHPLLKNELNQIHSKVDKILSIVQKLVSEQNTPISEKVIEEVKETTEDLAEEVVKKVKAIKKSFTPKIFKKKK